MLRRSPQAVPPHAVAGLPTALLLLAVAAAGASPSFAATLSVDDSNASGVVGDALLSLSEAIRLAGGQLSTLALSDAERAHIDGEPGASSRDLIRVELGEGAILATGPDGPTLIGNEGDVLDGGGAVLRAAGALAGDVGLLTRSSQIEIRRFSFDGYLFGVIVEATPGDSDLEDIRISENTFSGYETGLVVMPNARGSKGLRGLRIERNRFVAGAGSTNANAIVVLGAFPRSGFDVSSDYVMEDVVIRKNEVEGGNEGIQVFGAQARPGGTARDGRVHGVRILQNEIRNVFDVSIAVYAGFAFGGGDVSGIEVSDVEIAGNRIVSDGTPSTHIWVVPGLAVFEPGGLAENNVIRDVSIARNRTSGGGECSSGIQIQASQNEVGGGTVRGNLLEGVEISENSVAECGNGVGVFSGLAAAGHGLVEGNEIRQVLVRGNRLTDNRLNVDIISGLGVEGSAGPLPSPGPALIRGNLLDSISVVENRIRGGESGIFASGGVSAFTSDRVIDNSLSSGSESDNSVIGSQFPCRVFQDVVLGAAGGAATGNRAEFECSAPTPPKPTGRPLRVTTFEDELNSDGDCSLREAILAANTDAAVDACGAGHGVDAIRLPAGRYVRSSAGQLDITSDLRIRGAGASETVIDAAQLGRVFHVPGWSVALEGLTIENGLGAPFDGGIHNAGVLFLTHCVVRGNTAELSTGGIANLGTMVIRGSAIVDNTATREHNGGIFNAPFSRLTLLDSTVGGNTANLSNGGIANLGTLEIVGSSIVGNIARNQSIGGIFNDAAATLTLVNSTVSGNTANLSFGAIFSFGTLELVNSTVSNNAGGLNGGIFGFPGSSVTLKNTIVAGNAGRECTGAVVSAGHNLASDNTCQLTAAGDLPRVDPLLGPLADNGGSTETHALLEGSPAIDAIAEADCIDLAGGPVDEDQRGVDRPQGAGCDIGAFERRWGRAKRH